MVSRMSKQADTYKDIQCLQESRYLQRSFRAFLHRLAEEYLSSATKVFVDDPLDIPGALLDGTAQSALLPTPSLEAYARSHPGEFCKSDFQIGPGATRGIAVRRSKP